MNPNRHSPYLKWTGGKSRILEEILSILPEKINTYFEPFLGAGIVALNVNAKQKILSDVNQDIISCHQQVILDPYAVIDDCERMFTLGRDEYYCFRNEFNCLDRFDIYKAALFIYLNKHGYNGMCRYNKKHEFNIPVGKGSKPKIPVQEILNFSEILAQANIGASPFEIPMSYAESGDVIYCDPPYVPASATKSNINYSGDMFTLSDHARLLKHAIQAKERGVFVAISNHDIELTRELYSDADEIVPIEAYRSVSCKNDTRGKVGELVAIYDGTK